MIIKILLIVTGLLIASPLMAQSVVIDLGTGPVTMTPNANQLVAIQRLTALANVDRAAQKPPLAAITAEEFIRNILVERVQNMINDAKNNEVETACKNYAAASQLARNQINTALGNNSPCR